MRPAIFLDRDGTLIEEVNYLSRVEDLRLFPFTADAITRLKDVGFLIVVVTNQSGIGRGIFDEGSMHAIHDAMQNRLGRLIDAFYFCPHLPCDGCKCRKPGVELVERAARDLDIDLSRSWFVGDKKIDIETGVAAGMRTSLVLTGYGMTHQAELKHRPAIIAADLGIAAEAIATLATAEIVL